MRRRPSHISDLLSIGIFAPVVIASRMQNLALQSIRPTPAGRREALRMTTEKPLAMLEGGMAAQKQMFESGLKLWSDAMLAANAFLLTAPAMSMAAAVAPVRRRVEANARRLSRH